MEEELVHCLPMASELALCSGNRRSSPLLPVAIFWPWNYSLSTERAFFVTLHDERRLLSLQNDYSSSPAPVDRTIFWTPPTNDRSQIHDSIQISRIEHGYAFKRTL